MSLKVEVEPLGYKECPERVRLTVEMEGDLEDFQFFFKTQPKILKSMVEFQVKRSLKVPDSPKEHWCKATIMNKDDGTIEFEE